MPDQEFLFGIFADPLSSIMAALSKKRSKNKVVAKLLALGLICDPKEVRKKRQGKGQGGRGRRADCDNSGDEGEEGAPGEDEDSGQLGVTRISRPHPHPVLFFLYCFFNVAKHISVGCLFRNIPPSLQYPSHSHVFVCCCFFVFVFPHVHSALSLFPFVTVNTFSFVSFVTFNPFTAIMSVKNDH